MMGYDRKFVDALFESTKETIETVDQGMDIMFDTSRHNFFTEDEVALRIHQNTDMCLICNTERGFHSPSPT